MRPASWESGRGIPVDWSERLSFVPTSRSSSTLDRLSGLIAWTPVGSLLEPLYPASKGEPGWPPLAMFKALLLAVWHDLSDVKLADALEDRASFRIPPA
jgi:transposase, IS5 family